MKKRVLIVDDQRLNREILRKLLAEEYEILEAQNGQEALDFLLEKESDYVAAVVLDIIMPVMNGFSFLRRKQENARLQNLPVLVTTGNDDCESEKQALQLGAWDYVTQPYDAEILRFRLRNVIARSRMTAFERLRYIAEYDVLTDIFNKDRFFSDTRLMLDAHQDTEFALFHMDIDRFKLVNSFYGTGEGDDLLKYTAGKLKALCTGIRPSTYGRMESDVFAFCLPYTGAENVYALVQRLKAELKAYMTDFQIVPAFGIYVITDRTLSLDGMLDRAAIAARQIKGSYVLNYAFFAEEMQEKLEREQQIVNEMNGALESGQFEVYYQPKYELKTRRPRGAEALVRWRHPRRGLLPPGHFLPVFEHNGFISSLDRYVWEQVCRQLRIWIDAGYRPDPVSVNVSRVDMYNPNLPQELAELTDRYGIPPGLLHLEVTESIFAEQTELLNRMVQQLRNCGFLIMMDDFGSGYSSFNVLKDVDVDVLKIDMRFLSGAQSSRKSRQIVTSVVEMAHRLSIGTVAEGVETPEQAAFLDSIGCEYGQGFWFARPQPCAEYEELVRGHAPEEPAP